LTPLQEAKKATESTLWSIILSSAYNERLEGKMETSAEERKFWRALACFAVAGILLIITAYYLPDIWKLRRLLLEAIGEAFIVAAILGLTVDKYLKGDLVRRASQDVHKYLVGYNLPDEIKQRIQQLMGTVFIRRNWHIAYMLSPSGKDEVVIDVVYSYELENVSNEVQDYLPMIQIEKHLNPTILELRCDDPDSRFRISSKAGESLGKEEKVPGLIELRANSVKVKPTGTNGLRYPFSAHFQLRTPHDHSDTFSFGQPSIGVTIAASYPPEYSFSIEPEPGMIATENMWQIRNRAFLRSEHVVLRWFKIEPQDKSSASSQT